MSLTLKFWGVRGSLPSAPPPVDWISHTEKVMQSFFSAGFSKADEIRSYLDSQSIPSLGGYGVGTTCVEVSTPKTQLIIDGGSGIKNLSDKIMSGSTGRVRGRYNIYMTHFHWDHVIGLPFFTPHFIPGCEIHYYSVEPNVEKLIRQIFEKPYFPVPFEELKAKIFFHIMDPRKPYVIEDLEFTAYELDHPDPCFGLRVQSGGKAYSHCVDTEGTRMTREELGADLPLYQGIDLMYFDAQYPLAELAERANWGHSSAQVGLDIALREAIPHVLFAHHDPSARISDIEKLQAQTEMYYISKLNALSESGTPEIKVKWDFAHEGFEIKL